MGDYLEYPNLVQEVRGAMHPGRLKLQSTDIIFKNSKTGKVDHFQGADVDKAGWLIRARGYCLKFVLKNDTVHRFDGFKETDFEKLSTFLEKNYEISLTKKDVSVKGWNWGTTVFEGNSLSFEVGTKTAFEIPLGNVSHSTVAKNEVTLEFHQNDDAAVGLMEVRFHIPQDKNDESEKDIIAEFHQAVLAKADIIQATGESICTLQEVQCLTPRGRYDIKMYTTFLQLHGKTFDYKIPYTTVLRLFLLPHRDGRQMFFVMSLDPPIKQGQTRYHFLILLYSKEDEVSLELGLSEEDIKEKYEGKLTKEMSGASYEIMSRIMKALVNRKITVPGSFMGHSGTQSIACSYKAATGYLYPLERGFIFIHKPPIHIRFDEVSCVNFARSAGSLRSFDFDVETKTGTVYGFAGIEKDEYGKLYDYVSGKKLRVKNIGSKAETVAYGDDLVGSDSENSGDEHDAYMERMKREGKRTRDPNDSDKTDSDDEEFNPDELSASDVAEEWDTDYQSSTSEDEEGGEKGEGGEKKKEKKARRAVTIKEPDLFGDEKRKKRRERKERGEETPGAEGGKKKRKSKKKKNKDPNKPKRPQSSYFLWLNANRERIKEENPGIAITELSKKAGEEWKTVEDRTKWDKLAEEAKENYKKAMEEYNANKPETEDEGSGGEDEKKPKKAKKQKASTSPKKAVAESKGGTGDHYKSKEFISSSGSASDDVSEDDKPLKKKPKLDRKKKELKDKTEEEEDAELPEEEEILSTPPSSGKGSGSDSEAGSD